jgi:hypothetical protein
MHELSVDMRNMYDHSQTSVLSEGKDYKLNINFFKKESTETGESILTIYDLVIPPQSEIVINFGIVKNLMQFEKYPNDPSRGLNIMQMPVLYQIVGENTKW